MPKIDFYSKIVLTIVAACLLVLVFHAVVPRTSFIPVAEASGMGKLNYAKDGGIGLACSADGRYVYVSGNEGVIRSDDYGSVGSWEKTLKED